MSVAVEHAPLFGCEALEQLHFSRAERRLLKIVRQYDEHDFNRVALRRNDRQLALNLCHERRNCIQWLSIRHTDTILEVGAGAGALTGELAGKALSVTAIEASQPLSFINAVRQRSRTNIEIHGGAPKVTFQRLAGRTFDIITLVDVLHDAARYVGAAQDAQAELLRQMRSLLKPGRIVLALPNRFGLKSWAGGLATEDAQPFASIEGEVRAGDSLSLSRNGVEQLARTAGLRADLFYYPYPDCQFTSHLFSDACLPRKGETCFNRRPWDAWTMHLFHPGRVFDGLIEEGLFPFFSNAFLVELYPDAQSRSASGSDQVVYSKFASRRRPEYRLRTDIVRQPDGQRYILKQAADPAARQHVESIHAQCGKLETLFAGTPLTVNRCTPVEAGVRLDFLTGPSLAEEVIDLLHQGEHEAFLTKMETFFEVVRSLAVEPFQETDAFHQIFGTLRLPQGLRSAAVSDIDLILPNILVHDGQWHVIDYEWTFDFPIPIDFVIYRTLRYLFSYSHEFKQHRDLRKRLYAQAGLDQGLGVYSRMELAFQRHIVEAGTSIEDLSPARIRLPRSSPTSVESLLRRWLPPEWSQNLARLKQHWSERI